MYMPKLFSLEKLKGISHARHERPTLKLSPCLRTKSHKSSSPTKGRTVNISYNMRILPLKRLWREILQNLKGDSNKDSTKAMN